MKTYEEYQESGIGWLGETPSHWQLKKLKFCVDLNTNEGEIENVATRIALENIESKTGRYLPTDTPSFEGIGNLFSAGDILFSKLRPYLAKVLQAETNGIAVGEVLVLSPRRDEYFSRFLLYRLLSQSFIEVVDSSTYGSKMPRANWGFIGEVKLPVPPLPEQRAIAAYLDRKTAQLDTLLAQKEALLQMLHQKRQALINEAVTQGLDPAAPRKPSGVAWLGDVPAHWEVKALKYLLTEPMMYGANEAAELDDRSLPRYIRITDFGQDGKLRDETYKSLPHEVAKNYLLRNGDILFARSGATVGKTFFFSNYEGQACFAGYLIKGTFDTEKVLPEFVYLYTKSGLYENWKNSIFIQSTIQNISAEKYKALLLAVPPIKEQQEIIAWLEQRNKPINAATAAIHTQIKTLKAYRQSLISEVVTGKVDVRTAEAVAPEADLPLWRQ